MAGRRRSGGRVDGRRDDVELVARWRDGDQTAFAEVFDRYGSALYAVCVSLCRDHAEATDVVQETFARAATRLWQLREPSKLRPWLFAIARNEVRSRARRTRRLAAAGDALDLLVDPASAPDVEVARRELSELVWAAADGLNARDREVLALHLRAGLEGAELAAALGVTPAHAYVLTSRLRDRMEKAVGALLLARATHRRLDEASCAGLASLLEGWDGRLSIELRSRVTRHVERCRACEQRRRALVTPGGLVAGSLAPLGVPVAVRAGVLNGSTAPGSTGGSEDPGLWQWRPDGFPALAPSAGKRWGRASRRRRSRVAATAVAAALALVGATVAIALTRAAAPSGSLAAGPSAGSTRGEGATAEAVPSASVAAPSAAVDARPSPAEPPSGRAEPGPPGSAITPDPGPVTRPVTPAVAPPLTQPATPGLTQPVAPAVTQPVLPPTPGAQPPPDPKPVGPSPGSSSGSTGGSGVAPPVTPTQPPIAPPAPGRLEVVGGPIRLGADASAASLLLRNPGGTALRWTGSSKQPGLGIEPAGGELAAGTSASVTVSLDRAGLPEGDLAASVVFGAASGSTPVDVVATVEHAPVLGRVAASPATLTVAGAAACSPLMTTISVLAEDESALQAEARWGPAGPSVVSTTLEATGGNAFAAPIGPFSVPGRFTVTVVVTDARGNQASSTVSVTVQPCPTRTG